MVVKGRGAPLLGHVTCHCRLTVDLNPREGRITLGVTSSCDIYDLLGIRAGVLGLICLNSKGRRGRLDTTAHTNVGSVTQRKRSSIDYKIT